ncbi:Arabinogalactan endo-beta-1 4-galactanase [Pyrenophora tritici-repentis]|nr:Arabinogalactan endo-beta-1 4-galactanase [Pyrenophora tritici-repentis]
MARNYGRETNWPSYCPNPSTPFFPRITKSIPIIVDGQTQWMKEVAKRVAAVPNEGTGLFYWEPAWIDNPGLGSSCGWNLMVADDGKVMSSFLRSMHPFRA